MESKVAEIGNNALVLETKEEENKLGKAVFASIQKASEMIVESDDDYRVAGEEMKRNKWLQKQVTDYWEPLRVSAKASYDAVLARRKEMLDPLKNAEDALKNKTNAFMRKKEEERRAREAALRKQAEEAAARKLEEAAAAEEAGDEYGAEYAMAEAEMMESAANTASVKSVAPSVDGIRHTKTWVIDEEKCDWSKVPVSVAGVELRPVDKGAVKRLIKAAKGNINIPGVVFTESYTTAVSNGR